MDATGAMPGMVSVVSGAVVGAIVVAGAQMAVRQRKFRLSAWNASRSMQLGRRPVRKIRYRWLKCSRITIMVRVVAKEIGARVTVSGVTAVDVAIDAAINRQSIAAVQPDLPVSERKTNKKHSELLSSNSECFCVRRQDFSLGEASRTFVFVKTVAC